MCLVAWPFCLSLSISHRNNYGFQERQIETKLSTHGTQMLWEHETCEKEVAPREVWWDSCTLHLYLQHWSLGIQHNLTQYTKLRGPEGVYSCFNPASVEKAKKSRKILELFPTSTACLPLFSSFVSTFGVFCRVTWLFYLLGLFLVCDSVAAQLCAA